MFVISIPVGAKKYGAHKFAVEQNLSRQHRGVVQRFRRGDSTFAQYRQHVCKIVQIDGGSWRITLGHFIEIGPKAFAPAQHAFAVKVADVAIEQVFLIADRRDHTSGMAARQAFHHFGEQLQTDKEGVRRVVVQSRGTR